MKLHIFNPENDLALADGGANYCPPPAAASIANDLCTLPLWFASPDDAVLLKEKVHIDYCSEMQEQFTVARPFSSDMLNSIEECVPWGWSSQMLRRLESMGIQNKNLPEKRFIEKIRDTSNRRTSIKILQELAERGVDIPVFGMVKDDRHRTNALLKSDGSTIGLKKQTPEFRLVASIQEEVHRFAIDYHRKLQRKRVKRSVLSEIDGVGDATAKKLLKHFGSIKKIKEATLDDLKSAKVNSKTAEKIIEYFR